MSLSKPSKVVFTLLGMYYEGLYNNPLRTKALTSCGIGILANLTSQFIAQNSKIDNDSLVAFGLYGLIFGGSIPHFFFKFLDRMVPHSSPRFFLKHLLIERLFFMPIYQMFSIYMLGRLEGKNHNQAIRQLFTLCYPLVVTNWKFFTVLQALNFYFVPPVFRVMVNNLIGFVWTVILSYKKRKAESRRNRLE